MSTASNQRIRNLFLQQSYQDAWEDYLRTLNAKFPDGWDYLILTASNVAQAGIFEQQLELRRKQGKLPSGTHFAVLPDPDGQRIGSGGATLNVLDYVAAREGSLKGQRMLVIHSGGDSKRIPQYSACGKLFSPVPRLLPDGRSSTLFDEILIAAAGMAGRVRRVCWFFPAMSSSSLIPFRSICKWMTLLPSPAKKRQKPVSIMAFF